MNQNISAIESLHNLSSLLRDQQRRQCDNSEKLPSASDWDILRAMLGKPWGVRSVQACQTRKAG